MTILPLTRVTRRSRITMSSRANAGVGYGVGDVGKQVYGDVRQADREDAPLNQSIIAVGDCGKSESADAGPTEDRFGNDGAGEQAAELQADDGEDRDEGVSERVAVDNRVLAEA